jgi:carbon monoxide dehydrogenase subunit G
MDITGTYTFNAPPTRVWELLMDPDTIASCVPGCEQLEADGENRYRARLTVALAAITGSYDGTIALSDIVAPERYVLTVEGQGRPGFAKGSATISLRPDGAATIVEVKGTMQTGGAIARLGQRLIGSVSKMMQDRFFACLQGKLAS